jgi:GNAT superfamily N-acetyltransferase
MAPAVELSPTIDRDWLERASSDDPVSHAYAVWDLDNSPDRVRFVSARSGKSTEGYLLWWTGVPAIPIVHWVGGRGATRELAEALPERPLVVIAPTWAAAAILERRGPAREFTLVVLVRERGPVPEPPAPAPGSEVRRLERSDLERVGAWASAQEGPEVAEYRRFDPEREVAWGAFDHGEPVGVARAAVRLPALWVLGGVYVAPGARRGGWGRRLATAVVRAADEAGARVLTFVRDDRTPARRLYTDLAFRPVGRRAWIDAGAGLEP